MSDGPHRSLPMRPGWRRVAESADNQAFESDEIRDAIAPALEQDCRGEMTPEFISSLKKACANEAASLFKDSLGASLESLRNEAGSGMGSLIFACAAKDGSKR